jgi:membrane protease YdiL (CAAX protease family)
VTGVRLGCWTLLIGAVAALNYAAYGSNVHATGEEIYSWSSFADGIVFYGLILGLVVLIAIERWDLFALRAPRTAARAAWVALTVIVSIVVWEFVVTILPFEDPGKEQGLTPKHWEPAHASAFAANVLLFCVVAPVVEELTFRGVGQSLLRERFGVAPAIVLVGIAFGAWHGLLIALLILIPFGSALAYLRERTDSVLPGMVVHALFNAAAIAVAVSSL